jgi:glyoxylase-like metal-dependent hydrolase (beta-lactamase superfamily II)
MVVHHLNCGTINPLFPKDTQSILYCLLLESNQGLILVDTGFGTKDYIAPTSFIRVFTHLLGISRSLEETAVHQIETLGFSSGEVKHIVLTHLHCDHTGGLPDFPHAQVHVFAPEFEQAIRPKGLLARFYESEHWRHEPNWCIHDRRDMVPWFGFDSIRIGCDIWPDIRLIPLPGHTKGHCGVAVSLEDGWLLHAGDATYPFYHQENPMPPLKPLPGWLINPPGFVERVMTGEQTPRLMALIEEHGDGVQIICSNDSITYSHILERSAAS